MYGIWLSVENYTKRGGIKRYEVASKAKNDSWSAKNMFVLGIIILGFIAFHLTHFWAKMQLREFMGSEAENPYYLLITTFKNWWVLALYIVCSSPSGCTSTMVSGPCSRPSAGTTRSGSNA